MGAYREDFVKYPMPKQMICQLVEKLEPTTRVQARSVVLVA
jgi:hypothetical protein